MGLAKLINFNSLGDVRGNLIALEENREIPFQVKRIYYLFDTKAKVRRGFHAHKKLKQIAIVLNGSCRFLLDDGHEKTEVLLDSPTQGLYIESFVWREMFDFSSDCVLIVLANEYYDEDDYVRDFEQFTNMVRDDT